MRKHVVVVALTAVVLVLASDPSLALVSFGARLGYDDTSFDEYEAANFTLGSGTASVVRGAISRPLLLGASLETGLLPIFDLEVAAEAAFRQYNFSYTSIAQGGTTAQQTSDDVYYARASVLATVKKNLAAFPPVAPVVRIYAGAGVGMHFVTPLIGQALIEDKLDDPGDALDAGDIVDYQLKPGAHFLGGVKLKVPLLPFALSGEARYIIKSEGDYEEPGSHWSGYAGLALGF